MGEIESQRNITFVDIAKFIAMFLVIAEHVIIALNYSNVPLLNYLRSIIVSFHMPIFFILTGYLYKQKSKTENYLKIIWALLIPYFIYQFIYLPFKLIYYVIYMHIPFLETLIKCMIGILLGDNLGTEGSNIALTVCPPLWFIVVIIQIRYLFTQINITFKKLAIISMISIFLYYILKYRHIDLYFCIDNTLYAIPYFTIGYIARNYIHFSHYFNKKKELIGLVAILSLGFLILLCNRHNYQKSIELYRYACGLTGSCFVFAFSNLFQYVNYFIKQISQNTLFILFFHFLCLFFVKWLRIPIVLNYYDSIFIKFIIWIVFSFMLYYFCYLITNIIKNKNWRILLGKYRPEKSK